MRIIIGQNFGLKYLLLISIEKLKQNLFISGDFYDGDLLQSVLNIDSVFWNEHYHLKKEIEQLILGKEDELEFNKIKFEKFKNKINANKL